MLDYADAVHYHVFDAASILVRVLESRAIVDRFSVERDDVGEVSDLEATSGHKAISLSGERSHAPHRVCHGEDALLAHVSAEDPRKRSERARMQAYAIPLSNSLGVRAEADPRY